MTVHFVAIMVWKGMSEPAAAGCKPADAQHSLAQMHSAGPIEQQLQRWWSQKR